MAAEPPLRDRQALIQLTRNEIRRLLAAALAPVHRIDDLINWSTWRRRRQATARASHYGRRGEPLQ